MNDQMTRILGQSLAKVRPEVADLIEQSYRSGPLNQVFQDAATKSAVIDGKTAVLFSGNDRFGLQNRITASDLVSSNPDRYFVIEQTDAGGSILSQGKLFKDETDRMNAALQERGLGPLDTTELYMLQDPVWRAASENLASHVTTDPVLLVDGAQPGRVFLANEVPALQRNPVLAANSPEWAARSTMSVDALAPQLAQQSADLVSQQLGYDPASNRVVLGQSDSLPYLENNQKLASSGFDAAPDIAASSPELAPAHPDRSFGLDARPSTAPATADLSGGHSPYDGLLDVAKPADAGIGETLTAEAPTRAAPLGAAPALEAPSIATDALPDALSSRTGATDVPGVTQDAPSAAPAQDVAAAPEIAGTEPALPGTAETTAPASDPLAGRAPLAAPEIGAPEAPAEITGPATGRFTPNFVGVIGQSPTASKIFTGAGVLGAVGLAADAGLTGYNAYQLYNNGQTAATGDEVAGFGGRLSGSLTGAYLGGEAGALAGPWGALGGALVGGVGGAILGDKGVRALYENITGYQPPAAAAAPTPGWPDQFAAEFDRNNGGAPFSDPMTGFQPESQADYDARRQSYVDSKMADQASQGQQLMDSLRLMPGVDSNALAQNPAVGAPTPPEADAQNGLDGANATAPLALPAPEPTQPAPIDSTPAEMSAPSLTSADFAPPTLPDQPSGFGTTLPGFNLSAPPATEQPLPAAPEPAALPPAIDAAPAQMTAPSLTPADFAPPTLPDQPSGFTPTLPSFDLNSGFNTGLNSGIGSFDSGINPGFNSGINSSFDSGINSSFNSGFNSSFDSGTNSGFNSGINSSFDSSFNSSLNSGLNSSFSTGSSFDSGLGSSSSLNSSSGSGLDSGLGSSFSDFGDSSFSSGSFGGDMGGGSFGGDMGPVVLDLADQGIHLTDQHTSQASFDADGNGVPNRIAWTIPGEGLLAFDANSSGTVDQTRELALRQWTPGAQTDLQGLVGFDTNYDGALDAADRDFGQFDVWRDNNSNGVSDPGELSSLVEAGVKSISLASDGVRSNLPDGSTIYGQGSFTRTDGSSGRLADVALAFAPDISAMRDQLTGAMAVAAGGPASPTALSTPLQPSVVPPTLGGDPAASLRLHAG